MKSSKYFLDKNRRLGRHELVRTILTGLLAGGVIVSAFALPNVIQLMSLFPDTTKARRQHIKRAIKRLEERKLIRARKEEDYPLMLTAEGEKKAREFDIEDVTIFQPKKWDGKWRLVMFDVPEKHKRARQALSFQLTRLGLAEYQKSVYICPYPCKEEVDFVAEVFEIRRYIRHFTVEEPEEELDLMREFGLG